MPSPTTPTSSPGPVTADEVKLQGQDAERHVSIGFGLSV